jgi:hypothetical protein
MINGAKLKINSLSNYLCQKKLSYLLIRKNYINYSAIRLKVTIKKNCEMKIENAVHDN